MKHSIPRPKKMIATNKTVPAAFSAKHFDPVFEPAVRVFTSYAQRVFKEGFNTDHTFTLVSESGMGDGYRISIGEKTVLTASNNTGMNYALATLLQLAEMTEEGIVFPVCEIEDAPDNKWRGVMLDLARCYHEKEFLFAVADLCWFYKISRFQLHLSDDQGIRFPFEVLPKAVSEEHYSKQELSALVEYCRDRGIVLVPEIDAPGHFQAFNTAYPELFEVSSTTTRTPEEGATSIMRMEESVFDYLREMYQELAQVFVDSPWIHIGGDEANIEKWSTCPISEAYRKAHGLADVQQLYGHCVARQAQMILDMGRIPAVWEGFGEQCNSMIPKETLVFVWESMYQIAPSLLKDGFEIINSSWQPLYIVAPTRMWSPDKILEWEKNIWEHWFDKSAAYGTPIIVPEDSLIAGGQMCTWGDDMQPKQPYAPRMDMLQDEFANLRERVPALAQKVWTSYEVPDKEAFKRDALLLDKMFINLFA